MSALLGNKGRILLYKIKQFLSKERGNTKMHAISLVIVKVAVIAMVAILFLVAILFYVCAVQLIWRKEKRDWFFGGKVLLRVKARIARYGNRYIC